MSVAFATVADLGCRRAYFCRLAPGGRWALRPARLRTATVRGAVVAAHSRSDSRCRRLHPHGSNRQYRLSSDVRLAESTAVDQSFVPASRQLLPLQPVGHRVALQDLRDGRSQIRTASAAPAGSPFHIRSAAQVTAGRQHGQADQLQPGGLLTARFPGGTIFAPRAGWRAGGRVAGRVARADGPEQAREGTIRWTKPSCMSS